MRLILNKELDNINNNVNIKVIEVTSTDFLNNNLDYFVYKYQIPLIKFTDTEEIFNIKNFKNNLNSSLAETLIIIDETDLELLSNGSGGGSGGSQDLQSVLTQGGVVNNEENSILFIEALDDYEKTFTHLDRSGFSTQYLDEDTNERFFIQITGDNISFRKQQSVGDGGLTLNSTRLKLNPLSLSTGVEILLPVTTDNTIYTIATLDDIPTSPISGTFTNPTSITVVNGLITAIS